jgi:hypothetical protein
MDESHECRGKITYGAGAVGSLFGYQLAFDVVEIDSDLSVGSSFGCIYREQNFDRGIWGVSSHPDNELL